jgi:hypothetical protein
MTLPLFPPPVPEHTCHARSCREPVPPEMLMCRAHWRRVPLHIQRAVWRTYRPGQCEDKNPSWAWHQAADAAIGFVARAEGLELSPNEAEALKAFI